MLKESIADGLCRVLRFDIIYSSYCRNEKYTSIHDIDLIMYIEELLRKYRADHFLSYILRSALKTCWNYIGQTLLEFDFGTKDGGPFLTLRFKVRPEI